MPKHIVASSSAPTPGLTPGQTESPLAQAIRFGQMLFVSGQGAIDPVTGLVSRGDIATQTRLALDNMMRVLREEGAAADNLVNVRVTLRNMAEFPRFDEAFWSYFGGQRVTRTCFGGTPNRPGVNVQIDCVAMFDQGE